MRRSLLIYILLFSLLTGCAPASAQEQPAPLTEAGVLDAYTQAAQVYDWFDLYSPSTGIEAIQTEDGIFYPVEEPGLETMADLETKVSSFFAAPLAEQLLSSGNYRDLNGSSTVWRRPGKQPVPAVQNRPRLCGNGRPLDRDRDL